MAEEKVLTVGFARCDITPLENNMPLAGYGAVDLRRSTEVIDRMYAHILCFGEDGEAKLIMITGDLIAVGSGPLAEIRARVSKATGVPEGQILVGGTHSHSVPALYSEVEEMQRYRPYLFEQLEKTAPLAVADQKPAKLFFGSVEVGKPGTRLNFCRHYRIARVEEREDITMQNIEYCGDNSNDIHASDKVHYRYIGHAQDVDPMLQVMKLVREDADDIVMVNFQAHAHITGGGKKTLLSSDYPGALVQRVEQIIPGTKCIFYNGAAGNINPNSRMLEDSLPGLTYGLDRDHHGYASILAAYVKRVDKHLQESVSSKLDFRKEIVTLNHDHSRDDLIEQAQIVADRFKEIGPGNQEIRDLCAKYGFNSAYQCNAIIAKSKRSETGEVEINAVRIGDCAMALSLGEYFNDLGVAIKKRSPFKQTFMKCYSGGDGCYFPSVGSPMNSYERDTTRFAPGSGEILVDTFVRMFNEMYEA